MPGSGQGFHPFNGRVSRHLGDALRPEDGDTPYLSYHDVRLMREDVDTLKNDWLTDNVIAFWQEYLEHECLSNFPSASVILLRPSMSFLLMQTPDPTTLKDALPSFETATHVFLPINDCRNVAQAEGGSHWSLLVVSVNDGAAFHYDSLHCSNTRAAFESMQKLSQILGRPLTFQNLEDSPQQNNGSDCGVFVCMEMQFLLKQRLLRTARHEPVKMSLKSGDINAADGRKQIRHWIEHYRKEGQKLQSRSNSPSHHSKSRSPPRID